MKRLLFPLFLIITLALQGVAMEIATSFTGMQNIYIISHWVFVFIICISVFFDGEYTYYGIIYAVIFGLLVDIVYTDMLGTYMLSYGLAMFVLQGIKNAFYANVYTTMLLVTIGIIIADLFIHGTYSMLGIVDISFLAYMWERLIPTIVANIIFLLVLYPFVHKRFSRWKEEYEESH